MDAPKNSKWFHERLGPSEGHVHEVKTVLFSKKTPFQHIEIVELGDYGLSLILDGKVQSTQTDEFIYHEVLVHPAMLVHPNPKRVMVIGGGEGATLREVLRHRSVERALMVDIDREVVEVSRAMLPEFHAGAFDDPRTELAFEDARRWLETHDQVFDVIIIDLSDPIEEGPCYRLYTREFYRLVNRRLSQQGTIALQSGSVAPHDLLNVSAIYRTLLTAFPVVCPYVVNVPCFGMPWGFQMASKEVNPRAYSAADYDKMIVRRIQGELKYLTGEVCIAQTALPKHLQARLASETRLIEDDAPLFIYHDHARALQGTSRGSWSSRTRPRRPLCSLVPEGEFIVGRQRVNLRHRRFSFPRPLQLNREILLRQAASIDRLIRFLEGQQLPGLPPDGESHDPVQFARGDRIRHLPISEEIRIADEPEPLPIERQFAMQHVPEQSTASVVGPGEVRLGREEPAERRVEFGVLD